MQSSAHALTITECSAKYKDAKAAGTLNGATWNDFRKSQCDLAPRKRARARQGRSQPLGRRECGVPDGRRFKIFE